MYWHYDIKPDTNMLRLKKIFTTVQRSTFLGVTGDRVLKPVTTESGREAETAQNLIAAEDLD